MNLLQKVTNIATSAVKSNYQWIADGKKCGVKDGTAANGFEYLGSLIYKKESGVLSLEQVQFADGYIKAASSGQEIDYFIKDHLGSVRYVADASGMVKQRTDSYPFGLAMTKPDYQTSDNRFQFNGKEKQITGNIMSGNALDYGARMYDPTYLPRWRTPDPLAEKYYSISPYVYCNNNPISLMDPDGKDWVQSDSTGAYSWMDDVTDQKGTPKGYTYVGANDDDILRSMGIPTQYETQYSENDGLETVGGDGVGPLGEGTFGGTRTGASAKVTTRANVNYGSAVTNNKLGRTFAGVIVTVNVSANAATSSDSFGSTVNGYFSVSGGANGSYTSYLQKPTGSYYYQTGTQPVTASVKIPASDLSSGNYLQNATVSMGYNNPSALTSNGVKMQWSLQTGPMLRPAR